MRTIAVFRDNLTCLDQFEKIVFTDCFKGPCKKFFAEAIMSLLTEEEHFLKKEKLGRFEDSMANTCLYVEISCCLFLPLPLQLALLLCHCHRYCDIYTH